MQLAVALVKIKLAKVERYLLPIILKITATTAHAFTLFEYQSIRKFIYLLQCFTSSFNTTGLT